MLKTYGEGGSPTFSKCFKNTSKEDKKVRTLQNANVKWPYVCEAIIILIPGGLCLVSKGHSVIVRNNNTAGLLTMMRMGRFSSKGCSAKFEVVFYPLKTETILSALLVI